MTPTTLTTSKLEEIIEHIEGMKRKHPQDLGKHEHSCYKYADPEFDNKRWYCGESQCDSNVCVYNRPFNDILSYLHSLPEYAPIKETHG